MLNLEKIPCNPLRIFRILLSWKLFRVKKVMVNINRWSNGVGSKHGNRGKFYFIRKGYNQLKLPRNFLHVLVPTKPILNVAFRMLSFLAKIEIFENDRKMMIINAKYKYLIELWFDKLNWTQLVFTCSKLTIETLEQGVKYVQS